MRTSPDLRASDRIPIGNRVRVVSNGRIVAYVVAVNLSLGGVLLSARAPLPVGSPCEIAILAPDGAEGVSTTGTVIREDARGTVIRFASDLARGAFETVAKPASASVPSSLLATYRNYYRVSWSTNLENCEALLGVTRAQFRSVFITTFSSSIVLAVVPVWLLRASIPPYPDLAKVLLAFVYGAIWLLVLQPTMDLAAFRVLKNRAARK